MKFVKGMMMGTIISAGVMYYYSEINKNAGKKIVKQGKKALRMMGMI